MQAGNVTTGVPNTKAQLGFYSQGDNKTGYKPVGFLVNENCEGVGTPAAWTTANGTPNWDYTAVPLEGAESLYLATNATATRVRVDFTNQNEVWAYFLLRVTNGTAPAVATIFGGTAANGGGSLIQLLQFTATMALRNGGTATVGTLSFDTTYHVWWHYRIGTGSNAVADIAFSTDGVRPTSGNNFAQATTLNDTNQVGRLWLGAAGTALACDVIIDKIRVSDIPIGDQGEIYPAASLNADLSDTLGALSLSSATTVVVASTESSTLGTLALTSAGTLPIAATESSTLGTASLSSAGTVIVAASLSDTLGTLGVSSAVTVTVASDLNRTLGLLGLASDGTVAAGGAANADLSVTLGSLVLSANAAALEHEPGGISGYLKREKGYSRLGGNVMVQTMGEATERAEKIMVGWRDEEEAMMLVQIIETFYD